MKNLNETFLAQYATSPILTGLLERFNKAIDPTNLIENFLQNVFAPSTATGWGLDVWGRIVGVGRVIKVSVANEYLGFAEAEKGTGLLNITGFNQGPFYKGEGVPLTQNYALTDDAFRKLIFCKAAANITDGSIQSLNGALMILFGGNGKNIWIEDVPEAGPFFGFEEAGNSAEPFNNGVFYNKFIDDHLNCNMTICYDFRPTSIEFTLIEQAGNFIRPSGVQLNFKYVST
ncbi:DUF2612 domain-containing protein [Acetobacteraceae bacterium]|nr:DUF2612 domain-containing protein [Acetobacteraceae bacterium]